MQLKSIVSAVAASIVFLLLSVEAGAQRQTPGRPSLNAQVVMIPGAERMVAVGGGSVSWCSYQPTGHLALGAEVMYHPYYLTLPEMLDDDGFVVAPEEHLTLSAIDAGLGGGYFLRLLSTRNRAFIVSAGVSGFVGFRNCSALSRYEKPDGKTYKPNGLILYFVPELQMEVFPFSNISLFVSARPRLEALNLIIGGSYPWFRFTWGGGLKFYL